MGNIVPRVDHVRNVFNEPVPVSRQVSRYISSWSEMLFIIAPASLLSLAFWYQASPARKATPPAPPAAATPAAPATPGAVRAPGAVPSAAVKPQVPATVKAAAARAVATAPKPRPALPGEPAVLTIGSEKLTKSQFEEILASLPDQVRSRFDTPQGRREFARQYGEMKMLALEARRMMDADPKLRVQWGIQIDQALASALMQQKSGSTTVDETALRRYYDGHRGEFDTVNGRHILIRFQGSQVPLKPGQAELTEAQAMAKAAEIRKRIVAGEDFAELARKESDDTGSGAAGGALGDFGRGMMVPPFEQAAFALPIGQVSEPVRSPFGFHIIQVQSKKSKTFEEARPSIEQRKDKLFIDDLKARNAIVLSEAYFGKE